MQIRALRVFEVGRFCEPVAVEGFSGGLDVLAGPNEMGKSTLFRALQMLLTLKHNSSGDAVKRLTPYGGGQPLVEADLEIEGKLWRISKRYGNRPRAQLTDLSKGRVVARGADADVVFGELLDVVVGPAELGLVWVGQKHALEMPRPDMPKDRGERNALTRAIQGQLRSITGTTSADAVRARVKAQLDDLVTQRGPRKGGRYDVALEFQGRLRQQVEEAQAGVASVQSAQAELDLLLGRFAEVGHPDVLNALELAAAGSVEELERVEQQRLALRQAQDEVRIRLKDQESSHEALKRFRSDQERLVEIGRRLSDVTSRLPALIEAAETATAEEEKARADGVRLSDQQNQLQQLMRARNVAGRLAERAMALSNAERLEQEVAVEAERMRSDPATSERIDRLKQLDQRRQLVDERIAAESPAIRIAYEPGAKGHVRLHGEVLRDGAEVIATETLTLEVPGIGRIEVSPGGAESRERDLTERAKLVAEWDELLAAVGAEDLSGAEALLAERSKRDRALSLSIAELRRVAPDGLVALRSDVADFEAQLGMLEFEHHDLEADDADLERRLKEVATALTGARQTYPGVAQSAKTAQAALAEADARATAGRQQMAELEELLGPDEVRAERLAELEARVAAVDQDAADALRKVTALQQVLPDDDALRTLKTRVETARRDSEVACAEAVRLRERRAALIAQIEALTNSGIGQRLAELEGELQRADGAVAEIKAEIDALELLREALQAARDTSREYLMAPLMERVKPYLEEVFGEAQMLFEEGFAAESLIRGGEVEVIDRLSDGTQEQLAILVRLAYALLLAEHGKPVPLMLDDPLAYSDAGRISQMFRSLSVASRHHQVVVLTCREQAFAELEGTRVGLSPWRVDLDW